MQTFLGMSTARVGLVAFGQHVGMYDVLDGNVYRTVPNGSGGLKKGVKSMADVQAAMAAPPAVTATASTWDAYFGGATGPGAEVKDILHQALNFFVDDAKLAAPGGLGSDILIAAEVGFGIASFVDPIGIADAGSGVIKLAQGDVSGALIDFGGIVVPFGAEKLLKAASKAPTSALSSGLDGIKDLVQSTKGQIDGAKSLIDSAGAARSKLTSKASISDLGKFDVGPYNKMAGAVAGLDAHHAGQAAAMKKFVAGYDYDTAPTILVPKVGHTVRGPNGILSRSTTGIDSARGTLARDVNELRRVYPDVPNAKLKEGSSD